MYYPVSKDVIWLSFNLCMLHYNNYCGLIEILCFQWHMLWNIVFLNYLIWFLTYLFLFLVEFEAHCPMGCLGLGVVWLWHYPWVADIHCSKPNSRHWLLYVLGTWSGYWCLWAYECSTCCSFVSDTRTLHHVLCIMRKTIWLNVMTKHKGLRQIKNTKNQKIRSHNCCGPI